MHMCVCSVYVCVCVCLHQGSTHLKVLCVHFIANEVNNDPHEGIPAQQTLVTSIDIQLESAGVCVNTLNHTEAQLERYHQYDFSMPHHETQN